MKVLLEEKIAKKYGETIKKLGYQVIEYDEKNPNEKEDYGEDIIIGAINLEKIKTIDDLLTNNLVLKKSVTVIHSNDESVFTGKINLLDSKKLVLSIIDYESITKTNKKTINIDDLICIDIVSVENFLLDKYIETNHL